MVGAGAPGAVVPAGGCPIATCFVLVATPNAAVNPDQVNDGPLFLNSLGQRFRDANNNGTIDAGEDTWN
ncbi:MAG: hypothetical protein GWO39_14110 [Gammaproteobacteria bacterium]|nr:hypothetical protein [Gammaproteobacteria bacterium]NIY33428.1 hypothetical protein [Gammaproteobacteria bacterium]